MKKSIIKVKRYKKPLMCLIGILIFVLGIAVDRFMNANADDVSYDYSSSNISYDSTSNSLSADNVKDAIDELYEKVGQCPNGYNCLKDEDIVESSSSNIIKAYMYDEASCITGNEIACKRTICYLSKNKNACSVGTIVDYKVNADTIVRFHVLHDDGDTMTMQSQRNTVYGVAWYDNNDISKGPTTIMRELKNETDDWINVNQFPITSETTSFIGVNSIDNLCINDSEGNVTCLGNRYDIGLLANTYRARMITLQEATDSNIGQCLAWVDDNQINSKSCRMFMNNYLYQSSNESYCKNAALCVEDDYTENGADHNWGYWTMGTYSSTAVWFVRYNGDVAGNPSSFINKGARAVVVVNK